MIIGVTGGVGSGKTSFVRELERCGAKILDADEIAGTIVEENQEVRHSLKGMKFPQKLIVLPIVRPVCLGIGVSLFPHP